MTSPAGTLGDLTTENPALKDVVLNGHIWWILPAQVPEDAQVDVSLWMRLDRMNTQTNNEMDLLQSIKCAAENLAKQHNNVQQGNLLDLVHRRMPTKVSALTLQTLCRFFVLFLHNEAQHLVKELVDYHSHKVDPRQIAVSTSFFGTIVQEQNLKEFPLTRMYLVITQYTTEKPEHNLVDLILASSWRQHRFRTFAKGQISF